MQWSPGARSAPSNSRARLAITGSCAWGMDSRYSLPFLSLLFTRVCPTKTSSACWSKNCSGMMDTYSHVLPGMDGGIADMMEEALG